MKVEVTILPNGDVNIEVFEVIGSGCVKLTEGLEQILGKVKERKEKPEYHLESTETLQTVALI